MKKIRAGGPGYERLPKSPLLIVGRASVPVIFKDGRRCPASPRRPGHRTLVTSLRREYGSGSATVFVP